MEKGFLKKVSKITIFFIIIAIIINLAIPVVYAGYESDNNSTNTNMQNNTDLVDNEVSNSIVSNTIEDNQEFMQNNTSEVENITNNNVVFNETENKATQKSLVETKSVNNNFTQTIENGTYEIVSAKDTSKLLTIQDNSNAEIWTKLNSRKQKFQVTYLEDGYYTIQVLENQKVLDVCGGHKENGTNVQAYESNGTDAQKWIIKDEGNGEYSLISKSNDLNLDVKWGVMTNGTNVQMYEGNGTNAQKFKFNKIDIAIGSKTVDDGQYKIVSVKDENKAITVNNNNSNVEIFDYTNDYNQRYNINYIGNGYYKIQVLSSKKVLDVESAGTTNGTNIQVYTNNGTNAQQWIIKDEGNGEYSIISKLNELYVDIAGGKIENGTNVQNYETNGTMAQRFKFVKLDISGSKTLEDGMYKIRTGLDNSKVIDISEGSQSNGANAQIWNDSNVKQQKFHVKYIGDGYYTIRAVHSKKSLDVDNASQKIGTNVKQFEFYNSDAQQWIIKDVGDGYYNIISKCNALCLDVQDANNSNGANIQVYLPNGTNAQKFKFEVTDAQAIDNGLYKIKMSKDTNKVLDIDNASKENGANVQIWSEDDVNQQKFIVEYNETTKDYSIKASHSNKMLDVNSGISENGTNVQQYDSNGSNAQRWKIQDLGDGTYNIISNCGGLYLDVAGGRTDKGTNVQIYEGNGTKAQAFIFEKTEFTSFNGIDVSQWNNSVDWNLVKNTNVNFAIIRCGFRGYVSGKIVKDSKFEENIQGALNAGLKVGVYFFTQATNMEEAIEEANYTLALVKKYKITYPIVIDSEMSNEDKDGRADQLDKTTRTNTMIAFCNTIKNAGYTPAIYASKDWLYNQLDVSRIAQYDTWLAHYTGDVSKPSNYQYNYQIWQYTSVGSIQGISGQVDINVSYKNY